MWYTVKEWLNERNWYRVTFWTIGLLETFQVTLSEGIVHGLMQITFWWAFLMLAQFVMIKDVEQGVDEAKWY
jgi:hypothetical protein